MIVESVIERPTTKIVRVSDLPMGVDRQEIVDFALRAAGETRSSHFGTRCSTEWSEHYGEHQSSVVIYTD